MPDLTPNATLKSTIIARETFLLHHDFLADPASLDHYLHPDLYEIAPNGAVTSRADIATWLLAKDPKQRWQISPIKYERLSDDTVLLTYQANSIYEGKVKSTGTMRSSIWRLFNQHWCLYFHQATPN